MKRLNYQTLREVGEQGFVLENGEEKVLQFGEGNFLRAFADYFIDVLNERCGFNAKVVITQPIAKGTAQLINEQQGLYTLYLRGFENDKKAFSRRVISCVSRCLNPYEDFDALLDCAKNLALRYIVSNTTEAGITFDESCKFDDRPQSSYPGKLTRFLYERYRQFGDIAGKGLVILACELIDRNGEELKRCVYGYAKLWKLESGFTQWMDDEVLFCSTLVDRIVTGYPRAEADELNEKNGYEDKLLDTGEIFGLWVIEAPAWLGDEIPFEKAGLPVIITPDHAPYKQRKVRILNGAHTSMVLGAYLAGQEIVRGCMQNADIYGYLKKLIFDEIIPTLTLSPEESADFANAVLERFQNPFIDHSLLAISLNSTSKWKARVMPSLVKYAEKFGRLPERLCFSLAAYIAFYRTVKLTADGAVGQRGDNTYPVSDDAQVLEFYAKNGALENAALAMAVTANADFWGRNLDEIEGLTKKVAEYLDIIDEKGMAAVFAALK